MKPQYEPNIDILKEFVNRYYVLNCIELHVKAIKKNSTYIKPLFKRSHL